MKKKENKTNKVKRETNKEKQEKLKEKSIKKETKDKKQKEQKENKQIKKTEKETKTKEVKITKKKKKLLTKRETEYLSLASLGCTNKQMAEILVVSESTAKKMLENVFRKLGAKDRANAASLGFIKKALTYDILNRAYNKYLKNRDMELRRRVKEVNVD